MKIKTAVVIFGSLLLGIFVALSASMIRISDLLDLQAQKLAAAGESIRLAEELKSFLLIHNRNAFLYSLYKEPIRLESRITKRKEIDEFLKSTERLISNQETELILAEVKGEIRDYLEKWDSIKNADLSPVEQFSQISQEVDHAIEVVDRFVKVNLSQLNTLVESINEQNEAADRMAVALLFIGGLVVFGIIVAVFSFIAQPLVTLSNVISRYRIGEHSLRAEANGLREIQALSSNFNSMADSLEGKRQDQMRFIASIAHDLRNPLSSISIVSQMLIAHSKEKEQELSRMIYRQVKNLDRLVSDLLDTIRIEAGQMNLSVSVQDIGLLVKDSVDIYRAGSGLHGLVTEIHGEPLLCECDGGRISQVINNLLSNAVKYSPNGGTVNVKGWKEREEIKFSVSDQGIGIDAQDIESIFQPFQRAKATRETIPGIGLGLSASKRLMEAHSGKLEVSSTPGKGSTFTVTLPVRSEIKRILPDESSKHLSAPTGTA